MAELRLNFCGIRNGIIMQLIDDSVEDFHIWYYLTFGSFLESLGLN